ncbi:hypothetical protein NIES3974_05440 [Calothrix sp. NIES-3974]|nr:hypothetical protein NIES3974_05440 [Calothrix sp. NIES-3974]
MWEYVAADLVLKCYHEQVMITQFSIHLIILGLRNDFAGVSSL